VIDLAPCKARRFLPSQHNQFRGQIPANRLYLFGALLWLPKEVENNDTQNAPIEKFF
jgi:hypothetical protein